MLLNSYLIWDASHKLDDCVYHVDFREQAVAAYRKDNGLSKNVMLRSTKLDDIDLDDLFND